MRLVAYIRTISLANIQPTLTMTIASERGTYSKEYIGSSSGAVSGGSIVLYADHGWIFFVSPSYVPKLKVYRGYSKSIQKLPCRGQTLHREKTAKHAFRHGERMVEQCMGNVCKGTWNQTRFHNTICIPTKWCSRKKYMSCSQWSTISSGRIRATNQILDRCSKHSNLCSKFHSINEAPRINTS